MSIRSHALETISLVIMRLSLLVLIPGSKAYDQWLFQQLPTVQRLTDVYFADSANGWIVGDSAVLHTTNAGQDWAVQCLRDQNAGTIAGISLRECWVTGSGDTLFHTTDSGSSWSKVALGSNYGVDSVTSLLNVCFFDSTRGWAVVRGRKGGSGVTRIARTTDGGYSWSNSGFASNDSARLIQFTSSDRGWAGGDDSPLFRSTTGGLTWDSLGRIGDTLTYDMQFVTGSCGWLSSNGAGGSSILLQSIDSGNTWQGSVTVVCGGRMNLRFSDSLHGWFIVPTCSNGNHDEIWRTEDGGLSWHTQYSFVPPAQFQARKIFFADNNHGWIVGDGGLALRTFDGGVTEVKPTRGDALPSYVLYQNAPNPFNPTTVIRFSLIEAGNISLIIYDALGREVQILVNSERYQTGPHAVSFSPGDFASGIYFYRLVTADGKFTDVKKMNFVK